MTIEQLIDGLKSGAVEFSEVMKVIDQSYDFTPTQFQNGEQINSAGENNGSCKIFAFAKTHQLNEQATLNAFGKFYTEEVLGDPEGESHSNIRNFMKFGWQGIQFNGEALTAKSI